MEETKNAVKELCALKEKLICGAKDWVSQGFQQVNTHEMGEITDMIKDLAEAEEKCWKACYYKKIVETMKEEKEEEELMLKLGQEQGFDPYEAMGYRRASRRGYDNWRYSTGRFAPSGRGHYDPSGYTPMNDPWMDSYPLENDMMGYPGGRGTTHMGSRSTSGTPGGRSTSSGSADGRMGYTGSQRGDRYERYNRARMGYHDSKDPHSKEHMDTAAREYVADIAESMKEIWKDADPAMRKEIKSKLSSLTSEMN